MCDFAAKSQIWNVGIFCANVSLHYLKMITKLKMITYVSVQVHFHTSIGKQCLPRRKKSDADIFIYWSNQAKHQCGHVIFLSPVRSMLGMHQV